MAGFKRQIRAIGFGAPVKVDFSDNMYNSEILCSY